MSAGRSHEGERVLLLSPIGIGNALLMMPMVEALTASCPDLKLDVVTLDPGCAELFSRLESVEEILEIRAGWTRAWARLGSRRKSYRWGFAGFPATRWPYRLPFCLARPERTFIHLPPHASSWGVSDPLPLTQEIHDVLRHLEVLDALRIPRPQDPVMRLNIRPEEETEADRKIGELNLSSWRWVGFHPGSSVRHNMGMKRWPAASFAGLSRVLREKLDLPGVAFLGPQETELRETLSALDPDLRFLSPRTVGVAAACVSRSQLMVVNDSVFLHLASARNVPCVALFGPSPDSRTSPWKVPMRVVTNPLKCRPCWPALRPGLHPACSRKDRACLEQLEVARVFQAVCELREEI